jgi:CubicO group peptidase (beta-lactamase class C family)
MNKNLIQIETLAQAAIATDNQVGMAISVVQGDNIVFAKGFGVKSLQTKKAMTPDSTFHVASISKTFVAAAIMQLVEKQKIQLDDPLIKHLPYFKLQSPDFSRLTIKQMLNHTAGFPDVEDYEWEKAVADDDALERYTRSLSNTTLLTAPATAFNYSNMAYNVLGDLIAKVSGVSFEQYMREHIFTPLEMVESSFFFPEVKPALRTSPHIGSPPTVSPVYPYNRMHAPSGTLNSNVFELSHWAIANLNGGVFKGKSILSATNQALLFAPTFRIETENAAIGLSWFLQTRNGIEQIEHTGSDTGYVSVLTLFPKQKMAIIILANSEEAKIMALSDQIRDLLLSH